MLPDLISHDGKVTLVGVFPATYWIHATENWGSSEDRSPTVRSHWYIYSLLTIHAGRREKLPTEFHSATIGPSVCTVAPMLLPARSKTVGSCLLWQKPLMQAEMFSQQQGADISIMLIVPVNL